jgi:2'-5' RNA ligase
LQTRAKQRLFFALYPGADDRARLHAIAVREIPAAAGRFVTPDNLHVTLLFAGAVAPDQAACLERLGAAIRAQPVSLALDRLGHWRGPAVIWAGCSQLPDALRRIAEHLRRGAGECGVSVEPRPFEVHMTLVRKATRPFRARTLAEPLVLDFDRVCLMDSRATEGGVRYDVVASWPLQTDAASSVAARP